MVLPLAPMRPWDRIFSVKRLTGMARGWRTVWAEGQSSGRGGESGDMERCIAAWARERVQESGGICTVCLGVGRLVKLHGRTGCRGALVLCQQASMSGSVSYSSKMLVSG